MSGLVCEFKTPPDPEGFSSDLSFLSLDGAGAGGETPTGERSGETGPRDESDFGVFRFVSFISRIDPGAGLTPPLTKSSR